MAEDDPAPAAAATFSWRDPHPIFVIVLVGQEEIPFGVHKDLVCNKSAFFSSHFEMQSNDQLEHIVKLPEVEPEVFGLAQNFMYTRAVFQHDETPPGYDTLISLYHAGARLEIHGLCKETLHAMEECRRITQHIPATPLLVQAWENTPDGSPLRKLLLQWAAEYVRSSESRGEFTRSLPHNVLSDLVVVMSNPDFGVVKNGPSSSSTSSSSSLSQGLPSRRRNAHDTDHAAAGDGPEWPVPPPLKHRHSDAGHKTNGRKASRASLPAPLKPSKKQRVNISIAPGRPFDEAEKLVFCADLIGRMLSGPGFWTRLVGPFKDAVNPLADGVPDYLDKITRPMDLSTIKAKMDRREYATADDFAADVRQICKNCYAYHPKGNPTWEACAKFEDHFEKNFAGMEKWLLKMGGEEPA
ncbi:Bromodomain-containing protein [Microdochium bolleyi]|uniref:Bromodomain-containing protein n=1 Tax=Microdochium bolleyi TaxID=196109 RepID=A0A136JEN7_9PEZI|nr:Bromodomain-containing protein [Microdochium bolleyi]